MERCGQGRLIGDRVRTLGSSRLARTLTGGGQKVARLPLTTHPKLRKFLGNQYAAEKPTHAVAEQEAVGQIFCAQIGFDRLATLNQFASQHRGQQAA